MWLIFHNVPNLRFSEFTGEWIKTQLQNECFFYKGNTLSKEDLSYSGSPCILYGQLYTTYKREIIHNVLSKTENRNPNLFYGISNDVIIPASGETPEDISTACCVLQNNIIFGGDLNVLRTSHNGSFLSYQLNGVRKYDIAKLTVGKSVVHLHNEDLKKLNCSFPTNINEENKIVNFMDLVDSRIETQNKIIEDINILKKKLNDDFFDSIKVKIKFTEIYKKASEGGTPDTSNLEYYKDGTIPFAKIENLNNKYLISCNTKITQEGLKNSSAWIVPKESVLLSNGATIGEATITKIDVATKQGILGIVPKSHYSAEDLYYLFKSKKFRKTMKRITTKGTMDAAYLKDLNNEYIYISIDEKFKRHIELMQMLDIKVENETSIKRKYELEKTYLLKNLFI